MNNIARALSVIIASAAMSWAGDINGNFDGKAGVELFARQASQFPEEGSLVPTRTYPGTFIAGDTAAINKSIDSAIVYARENHRSPELIAGLECLRNNGTVEQKEAFAYGPEVYVLPDSCAAQLARQKELKGIGGTVCRWVTEYVIRQTCKPNGSCMNTTTSVLRKACD